MTVSALRWFKAALVLQLLLLAYWLAMEVVDLFPWNDVAAQGDGYDLRLRIATHALPLVGLTALFALGVRSLAMLSAIGYALFLLVQLWTWWKPYAIGVDAEWGAHYAEFFARTTKILPSTDAHLAPDAQHLLLQVLTLLTLIASGMAVARMRHL